MEVVTPHAPPLSCLDGWPKVGDEEQAFPLITVKDRRKPHIALLSRAEIDVVSMTHIRIVTHGRRTQANLRDTGCGLLMVVDDVSAYSLELCVVDELGRGRHCGFEVEIVSLEIDSINIPLSPLSFRTSTAVASHDAWGASREILSQMRANRTSQIANQQVAPGRNEE